MTGNYILSTRASAHTSTRILVHTRIYVNTRTYIYSLTVIEVKYINKHFISRSQIIIINSCLFLAHPWSHMCVCMIWYLQVCVFMYMWCICNPILFCCPCYYSRAHILTRSNYVTRRLVLAQRPFSFAVRIPAVCDKLLGITGSFFYRRPTLRLQRKWSDRRASRRKKNAFTSPSRSLLTHQRICLPGRHCDMRLERER